MPGDGWASKSLPPGMPSWARTALAAQSVFDAVDAEDPEDTVMVQLTLPELAIYTFGLTLVERLFPELSPLAHRLGHKMEELTRAQEYFSVPEDEEEDG